MPRDLPQVRIVQITDIHIGEDGRYAAGVDVARNYEMTMDAVRSIEPDVLVCTGDLVCTKQSQGDAEEMIAEWSALCDAVYIVPGNHDDVATLQMSLNRILGRSSNWPFVSVVDGTRMLFLDTADGRVGNEGRHALRQNDVLALDRGERYLVFMHHPPCVTGCAGLDRDIGIVDVEETSAALQTLQSEYHVFCGHFHMEGDKSLGTGLVHRTGAVSFQVPCGAIEFTISSDRPCLRTIVVDDDSLATEHICLR